MASGNDDRQHTPTATAAHTARYDLQADMVRRTSWRAVAPYCPDDDGSAYG